ncbi:MAG: hypothetical protein ACR2KG_06485 [Nocardioidaceae bacterium]
MVSNRQRRRQLAHAKWERQRARRAAQSKRRRAVSVVGGAVVGLAVVAVLGWLGFQIVQAANSSNPTPVVPSTGPIPSLIPNPNGPSNPLETIRTSYPATKGTP